MKKKITVSNYKGEEISGVIQTPGKDHLRAQQLYKSTKVKNKKAYTRKIKHKKEDSDSSFFEK